MSKYSIPGEDRSETLEPLRGGISGITELKFNGKYRIKPKLGQVYYGDMSWFGQFGYGEWGKGKYVWVDKADNGKNASGLSQMTPGIAYMSRETLKHWFKLTFTNGKSFIVRQVDIGPSGWTNKMIDINAPLAEMAGYEPKKFPTGAKILFQYLGKTEPEGATKQYRRPK
jgi:hypothetical protein